MFFGNLIKQEKNINLETTTTKRNLVIFNFFIPFNLCECISFRLEETFTVV